ncbi:hypothetical protein, partial [Chryseobacterium sp. SIMBA_029]|uniref:hypothetical protein n=1 Tax=Chryseobacterium sp. SIMBA_029 TaxID=3085772 RepID=UPI00397C749F
ALRSPLRDCKDTNFFKLSKLNPDYFLVHSLSQLLSLRYLLSLVFSGAKIETFNHHTNFI